MIAMLEGDVRLVDVEENYIFLKVTRGVSYQIYLTEPLIEDLIDIEHHDEVSLYIFTVYKENDTRLYGFETIEARHMFEHLLSVKGVGPATAMTILSSLNQKQLQQALMAKDPSLFMNIKGVGETTAKNIISKLGG